MSRRGGLRGQHEGKEPQEPDWSIADDVVKLVFGVDLDQCPYSAKNILI
jgi:hypothetical protein